MERNNSQGESCIRISQGRKLSEILILSVHLNKSPTSIEFTDPTSKTLELSIIKGLSRFNASLTEIGRKLLPVKCSRDILHPVIH